MQANLEAVERKELKRSVLKTLRNQGNIPGIVYGKQVNNIPVSINRNDFFHHIREVGKNGIFSVNIAGKKQQVILREYEKDPLTKDIIHVDFLAVDMATEITTDVGVRLVGEAFGVKDGGVLQQSLFSLSITAKATDLPESIDIDISNLKVAETITVGEIKNQYAYKINHTDDEVIASILPPKQEEEISTGEEQEPGIPDNLEGREE